MKKIYSFLMLLVMTAMCVTASAKTFTITVDDQNHIGRAMITNTYEYLTFSDNKAEFEAEEDYYLMIEAASGYQLESVQDKDGNSLAYTPNGTAQFQLSQLGDNSEIFVTTSEKEAKIFTFTGDERLKVVYNYGQQQYYAEDGVFTVPMEEDYSSVQISSEDPKLAIKKIVADTGNEHYPEYGTVEIYSYEYTGNTHFTIETYDPDEARTASITVKVNGNADYVSLTRSDYSTVSLTSNGETVVKFNPETEADFTISHSYYDKVLYQVKKNDEVLETWGSTYYVTVEDGDNIEISPDFPDVDVPVSFVFTNEGTEDVISNFGIDYSYNIDWKQENFSVKLGSTIEVRLNSDDYDIAEFKVNGVTQYGSSYTGIVTSEDGLEFVITANKKMPKKITIHCDDYENIIVYKGYAYNNDTYELTGPTTEIEAAASVSFIQISPAQDWVISYIEDSNGSTYTSSDNIYLSEGLEIFVGVKKLERDRNLTVYVGDGDWTYRSIILSQYNYDIRKEYSYNYYNDDESTLPVGYTTITFADFDCPIAIQGAAGANYERPIVYLNDELCEFNNSSYTYEGLDGELQDGDVLKLFPETPATYTVTYDIAESAIVSVVHDHSRGITAPSVHNVLEGTEVWIGTDAAVVQNLIVTVNGKEIDTDENGVYVFTVNEDATVKVAFDTTDGIQEIKKVSEDTSIYNLQGIRVGRVSDASSLPAGVYIINGKKVRI